MDITNKFEKELKDKTNQVSKFQKESIKLNEQIRQLNQKLKIKQDFQPVYFAN